MQKVGFNTSLDSNTIILENLGAAIEKMAYEWPNICSWVFNGLLSSIFITHKFLFSGHHTYFTTENYTLTTQEARGL